MPGTQEPTSALDTALQSLSLEDLVEERDTMGGELDHKIAEINRLNEEVEEIWTGMQKRKQLIDVLRDLVPAEESAVPASGTEEPVKLSKREMAERILRDSMKPLYPREVRDQAVERGWIENTRAATNQISVAMAKAVSAGKFTKDEEGRYSLPRQEEDGVDEEAQPQQLLASGSEAQ